MDKALTVLGEYRFWHPHRALCIAPHFVRWGEIYPIFGPRLHFFGAALTMTVIASPIPPDRRYRPVQEAESCKDPTRQYGNAQNPGQTGPRSRSDHTWVSALFGRGQLLARRASGSVTVSADDRGPGNAEIGSPPTTSDNVPSPIAVASASGRPVSEAGGLRQGAAGHPGRCHSALTLPTLSPRERATI